jgi:hypothetical protein
MDSDASNSSFSLDEEEEWLAVLERIKENDDDVTILEGKGSYTSIENMTNDGWEELGEIYQSTLTWNRYACVMVPSMIRRFRFCSVD